MNYLAPTTRPEYQSVNYYRELLQGCTIGMDSDQIEIAAKYAAVWKCPAWHAAAFAWDEMDSCQCSPCCEKRSTRRECLTARLAEIQQA